MAEPVAKMSLEGVKELTERLKTLDAKLRKKALRNAVFAASKPVAETAKKLVRRNSETGLLEASIARKAKSYRGAAVAIVGPETGRRRTRQGRVLTRKGQRFAEARRWPSKYAHLVERGAKAHRAGRRRHPGARPYPFLAPALASNRDTATQIIANVIRNALEDAGQ
jgi:HK97 gp10 family phage protein